MNPDASTSGCMIHPCSKRWLSQLTTDTQERGGPRDDAPALVMSHCCVLAPVHVALTTVLPLLESQQVAGALPMMPMAAAPGTTVGAAASSDRRAPRAVPPAFHGLACERGRVSAHYSFCSGGEGGPGEGGGGGGVCIADCAQEDVKTWIDHYTPERGPQMEASKGHRETGRRKATSI